jgi:signal recognition particle subunit SEC65
MAEETQTQKPTAVLIEWTGDNLKYIADKVFLNTGVNEVPASEWERLRWMVEDIIVDPAKVSEKERKEGRIIERFATVEAPKGKDTKSIVKTAKSINDLDDLEAIAVIEETNSIATLNKWKKASGKDSIRVAINDQIEKINKAESK